MILKYIDKLLTLVFEGTACVSISAFVSLIDILVRIGSSFSGLNIWVVATRIEK